MTDEDGNPVPGEKHPSVITLKTGKPIPEHFIEKVDCQLNGESLLEAHLGPSNCMKDFIGPLRVLRPIPNSSMMIGMDHTKRKTIQATRNSPPPFFAAILGNLQMLPVPTAMPIMASIMPVLVLKRSLILCVLASLSRNDSSGFLQFQ